MARYALGDDYHDLIPARIDQLVEQIEGWIGRPISQRRYSDTGPILERELAQRSGLGWIGKNTCLINPKLGSYFFLAELLLDVELPLDEPISSDHCGSCTRCIEACPTNCILPDRTLDARRCLSYLTIELKDAIRQDLRPQLGDWLFGCDICQEVCPWNLRFSRPTEQPAFQSRPFFQTATAQSYLSLDDEQYRQLFRGSPLKRAKRPGLARNAAVVAGNQRTEAQIEPLQRTLLHDPEPLVRRHAAWALGQFEQTAAQQALQQALEQEQVESVRREIEHALSIRPN